MIDPFAPLSPSASQSPPKTNKAKAAEWVPVLPVPADAPMPPAAHPAMGKPSARWTYHDAAGAVLGHVCRFDTPDGKQFRPLVLFTPTAGGKPQWRWEAWPSPRPLYGLELLAQRPLAVVVLCEGEKAADAARNLLPDHVAICSPNGAKSAAKADWGPLGGRHVVIWPDADEPGAAYAIEAAGLMRAAGALSVSICEPPSAVATGWDAADAHNEGWDTKRAITLLASARPVMQTGESKDASKDGKEGKPKRVPQRDQLMALTQFCLLWHGPDYEAYVTMPVAGHRESWPIRSSAFKRWLAARAYEETGLAPGAQALEDTLRVLEARAVSEGPCRAPWRRVGSMAGKFYLDMADATWRAIEITPTGWRIVEKADLPFIRTPRMRPLCPPEAGEPIERLRAFANVASDADFVLVVAWLLASMRDRGPYPILVLNGPQGTGKSSFSRLLRSLIDPSSPAIQGPPKDEQNVVVTAQNSHVLVYDNLSHIDSTFSDALCRLATGSGFAVRKLHTDSEENLFEGARPICVNGIPALAERADLNERSVVVRLVPISEDQRRPEDELDAEWELARPYVLGALLDALSAALRNLPSTRLSKAGRMADFEKLMTAAEMGLGWEAGTFRAAYSSNRVEATESAFEADCVAVAIFDLMTSGAGRSLWSGTSTDLLSVLTITVEPSTATLRIWPKTAQSLGNMIERCIPLLRSKGITIERRHSGTRIITIARAS